MEVVSALVIGSPVSLTYAWWSALCVDEFLEWKLFSGKLLLYIATLMSGYVKKGVSSKIMLLSFNLFDIVGAAH